MVHSRPGEDDRSDALEHLEDKVDREQLRLVLCASRHGVECGRSGEREGCRPEKHGRLAFGVLDKNRGTS
jgi:hypothetical protein